MDIYCKLSDNCNLLLKEIKCPNKGKDRPCSWMERLNIIGHKFSPNDL